MEKLSFRERFGYGIGTGGEQFPFFYLNAYFMFFLNVVVGLDAMAVGTMFLIARIWDAINDPIMGYIGDRTRSRWGSYRPWAFFATIPMGIFLFMMFTNVGFEGGAKLAYYYFAYILFTMSNTASIIPLGAMINVLSTDYRERSTLASFREFGSAIGNLSTAIIVPGLLAVFSATENDPKGYQLTSVILSLIAFGVLGFTFFNTKERVRPPKNPIGFFTSFKTLKGNTPAICLFISFFFICMFMVVRQMWNMYYAVYYLGDPNAAGMLLQIMAIAPLVVLYFIPRLTEKWGKRNMLIIGCGFIAISGALFMVAGTNLPVVYAASFIAGWGQVLTFSAMWGTLPDVADYGEFKTGVRSPGLVYALGNFMLKLAMSVGGFIAGVILTQIGFNEAEQVQTDATMSGIYLFNGLTPVLFGVLAALVMIPFKLTPKLSSEIADELIKRRGEADGEQSGEGE